MAGAIVTVADLGKRFADTVALDGVGFSVDAGEIFGLVGPDGAGKTTLMRICAGVMRPDRGAIIIDGIDVVRDPEAAKTRLSYMPQRFGLYEELTVDENIRFYADLFEVPRRLREERTAELLAASGIAEFRKRRAGQLSGGMKQKLGLICSLIHTPRLLLLDEPTTGVDPVSRRELWHILYRLRETGVTILISTAYLDEAERCTRLAFLNTGRLNYCDTPDGLKRLMPGTVVAIETSEPRRAREAIANLKGVSRAITLGDGVHVVLDEAARRIPELRAALARAGVPTSAIAVTPPGIEDVFIALLGAPVGSA
jgi:drug efflux transport system ATP-binding protein